MDPANVQKVNSTGWIPINFVSAFVSFNQASPISSLPIDPINKVLPGTSNTGNDLTGFAYAGDPAGHFYAYLCNGLKYEIQTNLESQKYGTDNNFVGGVADSTDSESVENKDGGVAYSSFNGSFLSDPIVIIPGFTPSFLGDQIYQVGNDVGL